MLRFLLLAIVLAGLVGLALWNHHGRRPPRADTAEATETKFAKRAGPPIATTPDFRALPQHGISLPAKFSNLTNETLDQATVALLRNASDEEFFALAAICLSTTNLAKRLPLLRASVQTKHRNVYDLLTYIIFEESTGRHLTPDPTPNAPVRDRATILACRADREYVLNLPMQFASLVETDSRAYKLLKDGCNPWFWEGRLHWEGQDIDWVRMFTISCMRGIGFSRQPDSIEFLKALRNGALTDPRSNSPSTWSVEGDLVEAAYFYYLPTLPARPRQGEIYEQLESFNIWKKTPEGIEWTAWEHSVRAAREASRGR